MLRAKEAGLPLEEIRALVAAPGSAERHRILSRRHRDLTARIDRLRAAAELLQCALNCDHDDLDTCPRFQAMVQTRIGAMPSRPPLLSPPDAGRPPAGLQTRPSVMSGPASGDPQVS